MGDKISQTMLCPCCGEDLTLGAEACFCGARFVGHPLDQAPAKVQQFGPVISALALMASVIIASLVFTKWLTLAAIIVLWSSRRAMRLAKHDSENYGGYRTAASLLIIATVAGSVAGGFGIAYIPQYLRAYSERQQAATRAEMYRAWILLEEYRRVKGAYPQDYMEYRKEMGDALPLDYWGKQMFYKGSIEGVALNTISRDGQLVTTGISNNFENFELRSAGPDEKMGTSDDIVMQDGIFITIDEAARRMSAPANR
jgi:hypothetical protein